MFPENGTLTINVRRLRPAGCTRESMTVNCVIRLALVLAAVAGWAGWSRPVPAQELPALAAPSAALPRAETAAEPQPPLPYLDLDNVPRSVPLYGNASGEWGFQLLPEGSSTGPIWRGPRSRGCTPASSRSRMTAGCGTRRWAPASACCGSATAMPSGPSGSSSTGGLGPGAARPAGAHRRAVRRFSRRRAADLGQRARQWKFAYYHISSHLGDEFLVKNPAFPRSPSP